MNDHCNEHRFYFGLCDECVEMRKAYIAYGKANPYKPKAPQAVYQPAKKTAAPALKPAPVVPMNPHPDITRSHHKGNQFSVEANPDRDTKSEAMEKIYAKFREYGAGGITRWQAAEEAGYSEDVYGSTGSARCTDLARDERIVEVWNPDGSQARGTTRYGEGSSAGLWCADIYGKPRPLQNGLILDSDKIDEGDDL